MPELALATATGLLRRTLPANGRDSQSSAFFRAPGIEELYSGELITKASLAWMQSRSCSAPGGKPSASCTSAL
jgi:hypothetical protein